MSTGYDMQTSEFEKQIKEAQVKYSMQEIITVIVAAVVGIAFLAVVAAPFFGASADPETKSFVFGLFGALIGAGGMFTFQQKNVESAQLKAEAAEYVVANLRARE